MSVNWSYWICCNICIKKEEGFIRTFVSRVYNEILRFYNDAQQSWNKWKRKLNQMCMQMCFRLADFVEIPSISVHYFSDVCELSYGQFSYIRVVSKEGKIHCCFPLGKTRAAPEKFVSIPRFKVTATTLPAKVKIL